MNNPIVQREFIGLLRTRRAFASMVALAAILTVLVVLRWPETGRANISGEQAQAVLRLFGYGMLASLVLLAPIFAASAVVREKQQRTLELLFNSPLSSWSIFWGKLVASVGFVVLLMILSIPAAAACYAMGGVGVPQLMYVYAILLLVAVQYAVVALYVSTVSQSAESALRYTYGAVLVLTIIPLIPQKFVQGQVEPLIAQIVGTFSCLSPVPAMMEILGHQSIGTQGVMGPTSAGMRYAIWALLVIAIFVPMTVAKLNYKLFDRNRAAGKITDDRSTGVKFYRRIMYLWFFDPQRRTQLIGAFTNPVMVKDFRSQKFGRSHWMMRFFVICMVISLGLMLATTRGTITWSVEILGGIIVIMQMSVVVLISPSLAAGAISSERESGGWTLLKMTPLSAFTIVIGKLMSAGRTLFLLLLATLPAYVVLLKIDESQVARLADVLLTVVLTSIMGVMVSAAVSSLFQRTTGATATSYTILVGLCGGTLLFWLGRGSPFSRAAVETALQFNPLATALSLIRAPGFEEYQLVPFNWYLMGGLIVLSALVLWIQTWRLTRPQ
ncbi:MAG: ABC transporter permease [Phycisphaerales bacterium]|nr:ABC transporter permease [Phycisphaerales bacterium]